MISRMTFTCEKKVKILLFSIREKGVDNTSRVVHKKATYSNIILKYYSNTVTTLTFPMRAEWEHSSYPEVKEWH